jgi:2,3-bisphosphoglycerate-independent phosphoglycerate mutase
MKRPLALIILDGWGYSPRSEGNAIALANTPHYDEISTKFPVTFLAASGEAIGLQNDSPGNSESGHLCIGSGRIVRNGLSQIDHAIENGDFSRNEVLLEAMHKAKNSNLHLIGLLSDANIHSSHEHLFALIRLAKTCGVKNVFIHATLDGVDVSPDSAAIYVEALEIKIQDIGLGKIATLCGRQWTMDAKQRWGRTARAYTMLVHAEGERAFDPINAIQGNYIRGILDEKIQPIVIEKDHGIPITTIKTDDVVIFFNHRGDGIHQLVKSLAFAENSELTTIGKPKIHAVCLTEYDETFNLPVAFPSNESVENSLADVFDTDGIRNCRLSETEKYSNVTFIFNGGKETDYAFENRILIKSTEKAETIEPEMSSFKLADKLMRGLDEKENDVFVVNFSAPDVIANSGILDKTIEAIQHIDTCLGGIYSKMIELNGVLLITSAHGNCEEMIDEKRNPFLFNTKNPVPFHFVDPNSVDAKLRDGGSLEDIAPTILGILGIKKPTEMTGKDLRI